MTIQMELRPCMVKGLYGRNGIEERKHYFINSQIADWLLWNLNPDTPV